MATENPTKHHHSGTPFGPVRYDKRIYAIKRKHTRVEHQGPRMWQPRLVIDQQSFDFGYCCESQRRANWFCRMMALAIDRMLQEAILNGAGKVTNPNRNAKATGSKAGVHEQIS